MHALLQRSSGAAQAACSSSGASNSRVSPVVAARRPAAHVSPKSFVQGHTLTSRAASTRTQAKKRVLEAIDDFGELFESLASKGMEAGFLPRDTLVLVNSCRSVEQAQKCLQLFAQVLEVRVQVSASVESDWHFRKAWYTLFAERAIYKLRKPELVYELVRNPRIFSISKYFVADLIEILGKKNETEDDVMVKLVELNRQVREPGCKGVKRAYMELMEVHKRRKDEELLKATKAALKSFMATPAAAAAPAMSVASVASTDAPVAVGVAA